jgi:hypothetical protein
MSSMTEASRRLEQSRTGIRRALRDQGGSAKSPTDYFNQTALLGWMAGVREMPGADVMIQALQTWWKQHPLRATSASVWNIAKTAIQPVAQRHPAALMAAAVAVGAVVAVTRPWRWLFQPAMLAAVMPHIVNSILAPRATPPPAH